MNTSLSIRLLLAAGTLGFALAAGAQQSQVGNPAAAALAAALPAPPPGNQPAGAAPAKPQANGAAAAVPTPPAQEALDPKAEAERRKAEEALRAKREEDRRRKAELERGCVIRPVMSDAEIARCR
jgi:hypothetical protein